MYLNLLLKNKYLKVESVLLIFVHPVLKYDSAQVSQEMSKKLSNTYFDRRTKYFHFVKNLKHIENRKIR